jgi:mono/diheme cytochrome c family protein
MRIFAGLLGTLLAVTTVAAEEADSTTEALRVLTKRCAGCHNQADHPGKLFLQKANLSDPKMAARMLGMIEKAKMPPAHAEFRGSAEGKKVIAFLREQSGQKR